MKNNDSVYALLEIFWQTFYYTFTYARIESKLLHLRETKEKFFVK